MPRMQHITFNLSTSTDQPHELAAINEEDKFIIFLILINWGNVITLNKTSTENYGKLIKKTEQNNCHQNFSRPLYGTPRFVW